MSSNDALEVNLREPGTSVSSAWSRSLLLGAVLVLLLVNIMVGLIPLLRSLEGGAAPNSYSYVLFGTTGFAFAILALVVLRGPSLTLERLRIDQEGLTATYRSGRTERVSISATGPRISIRAFHAWPANKSGTDVRFLLDSARIRGVPIPNDAVTKLRDLANARGVPIKTIGGNALNRLEWSRMDIGP